MKKYFQSTIYVIFVLVTFLALAKSFMVYENPFSVYENPLVWLALIGFALVIVLKEVVNVIAINKATELQNEKLGIVPEEENEWIKKLLKSWTNSKDIEQEDEIIGDPLDFISLNGKKNPLPALL